MTSIRWFKLFVIIIALLVMVACNSQSKSTPNADTVSAATTTKPLVKIPQPITATQALQKIEGYAQKQWAPDAMPVHIESEPNSEDNGQDGKATVWMAVFASMRKGEIRTFHWSGSLDPSAPVAGVSAASGTTPLTPEMASQMFQSFLVKADTDKAAATAVQHGGQGILKKFPDQRVKYILVFDTKTNTPLCYVVYGEELKKNRGFGVINAMTGDYVRGGKAG
jgi:hypothetical protein